MSQVATPRFQPPRTIRTRSHIKRSWDKELFQSPSYKFFRMKTQETLLQKIAPYSVDVLDPFTVKRKLPRYQFIKSVIISVFLLPLRILVMFLLLLFAWSIGITTIKAFPPEEKANKKPLSGWRRKLTKPFIVMLARLIFVVGGFHWIRTKGERATAKEAPILLLVPHTSFWDTVPVIALGCPCMVVKESTGRAPFFGDLINYAQPVYVQRGDAESRQKTMDDILYRCRSGDDWEQILIFPEGTVTNRKALLEFKLGAFHPAVPIQPVFIRYPNRTDTITWSWDGPGALEQMWLTLSQFHVYCELEFLPVYNPTHAEREDPRLYAENLRKSISRTCNIPITYLSAEDVKYVNQAKSLKLPKTTGLIKLLKLRSKMGNDKIDVKTEIFNLSQLHSETLCDVKTFSKNIDAKYCDAVWAFFNLIDQEKSGTIDARVYVVGLWLLRVDLSEWKRLEMSFKVFNSKGMVTASQFAAIAILWRGLPISVSYDIFRVFNMDSQKKETICFDSFKSVATKFLLMERNFHNFDKHLNNNNYNYFVKEKPKMY